MKYEKGFLVLEGAQNHYLNCHFSSVIFVQREAARQDICDFMCNEKTPT